MLDGLIKRNIKKKCKHLIKDPRIKVVSCPCNKHKEEDPRQFPPSFKQMLTSLERSPRKPQIDLSNKPSYHLPQISLRLMSCLRVQSSFDFLYGLSFATMCGSACSCSNMESCSLSCSLPRMSPLKGNLLKEQHDNC